MTLSLDFSLIYVPKYVYTFVSFHSGLKPEFLCFSCDISGVQFLVCLCMTRRSFFVGSTYFDLSFLMTMMMMTQPNGYLFPGTLELYLQKKLRKWNAISGRKSDRNVYRRKIRIRQTRCFLFPLFFYCRSSAGFPVVRTDLIVVHRTHNN